MARNRARITLLFQIRAIRLKKMDDVFKEPVIIRPAPNVVLNFTRLTLSPDELECRNLQSSFRAKKTATLTIGNVASVGSVILFFVIAVDVIFTLLTRKKDVVSIQVCNIVTFTFFILFLL